jgi:hypothetical protein
VAVATTWSSCCRPFGPVLIVAVPLLKTFDANDSVIGGGNRVKSQIQVAICSHVCPVKIGPIEVERTANDVSCY